MAGILLVVLLVLLVGGGGSYYGRVARWAAPQLGGGLLGLVFFVIVVLWLTGNIASGSVAH
jgi:hypothetical protein